MLNLEEMEVFGSIGKPQKPKKPQVLVSLQSQ